MITLFDLLAYWTFTLISSSKWMTLAVLNLFSHFLKLFYGFMVETMQWNHLRLLFSIQSKWSVEIYWRIRSNMFFTIFPFHFPQKNRMNDVLSVVETVNEDKNSKQVNNIKIEKFLFLFKTGCVCATADHQRIYTYTVCFGIDCRIYCIIDRYERILWQRHVEQLLSSL